jgi:hypothetical protein
MLIEKYLNEFVQNEVRNNKQIDVSEELEKYARGLFHRSEDIESLKRHVKKTKEILKVHRTNENNAKDPNKAKVSIKQEPFYEFCVDLIDGHRYLMLQHSYVKHEIELNRKNSWEFLNNEEEAKKAGWFNKKSKEGDPKLLEWADKAYPSINVNILQAEFDYAFALVLLKVNHVKLS